MFIPPFVGHLGVLPAQTLNSRLKVFQTTQVVCIWASKPSMGKLVDVNSQGKYCSTSLGDKVIFFTVFLRSGWLLIDPHTECRALWERSPSFT